MRIPVRRATSDTVIARPLGFPNSDLHPVSIRPLTQQRTSIEHPRRRFSDRFPSVHFPSLVSLRNGTIRKPYGAPPCFGGVIVTVMSLPKETMHPRPSSVEWHSMSIGGAPLTQIERPSKIALLIPATRSRSFMVSPIQSRREPSSSFLAPVRMIVD